MVYKLRPEKSKSSSSRLGALEGGARVPMQAAVGALSALPGFAGNIAKGVNDLIAAPITKAITGKSIPYEETSIGKLLPTTQQHQKNLEEGIPYLKPKNRVEKFTRDVASDTAELFLPGKALKMGKYAFSPLRSLGISTAANLAGEGVFAFTGDESKADMTKSGAMLVASLFNPTRAKDMASNLYTQARKVLPEGASISSNRLNSNLGTLESRILQKRNYNQLADSEKFVLDEINKIRQSTQSGSVDISTLDAMKRSLNETLTKTVFDIKDPSTRKRAKELAKTINGHLRDTLKDYGKTNPEWWKLQSAADKAHGAIAQSNFISRSLEKFMKGRPEGLAHLFGIGIPAGVSMFSPATGGLTAAGYLGAKIGTQMAKSPALRKHYAKVVGAAATNNAKVINKELDEMEKEIQKEKKPKYRLRPK